MEKQALPARAKAKSRKEKEALTFLKSIPPLAEGEARTARWYALQLGPSAFFGIFDTSVSKARRKAHLDGPIAAALMANSATLLAKDPLTERSI